MSKSECEVRPTRRLCSPPSTVLIAPSSMPLLVTHSELDDLKLAPSSTAGYVVCWHAHADVTLSHPPLLWAEA